MKTAIFSDRFSVKRKILDVGFKMETICNFWLLGLHNRVYIISVHNEQIFTKFLKSIEIQGFLRYSYNHDGKKIGINNIFRISCCVYIL